MSKTYKTFFILAILFLVSYIIHLQFYTESLTSKSKKFKKELTHFKREVIREVPRVVATLKIKPAMNILDIGAGTGTFTFPFAEALKGTGMVYATDINPNMVEQIKKKIKEFKYNNIVPVLVKNKGGDDFYKKHSFDIIFLCAVYQSIWHPKDYFRELKPSLKQNGRLYLLFDRNDYDFNQIMFGDWGRVINTLRSKGNDFPVFQKLDKETQNFIKNWQSNSIPQEIQTKIIQNFNQMLYDRTLYNELSAYYIIKENFRPGKMLEILDPVDRQLAKWLVVRLDENDAFDEKDNLTEIDKKRLHKLNRILLINIFQLDKFVSDLGQTTVVLERSRVIQTLQSAGYNLVGEYDFLPAHHFLEFTRN